MLKQTFNDTVVLPVLGRSAFFYRFSNGLQQQTMTPKRMIVVDQNHPPLLVPLESTIYRPAKRMESAELSFKYVWGKRGDYNKYLREFVRYGFILFYLVKNSIGMLLYRVTRKKRENPLNGLIG